VLVMGLVPQPFLDRFAHAADRFVDRATYGLPGSRVTEEEVRLQVMPLPPPGGDIIPRAAPPATAVAPAAPHPPILPVDDPLLRPHQPDPHGAH
jgi:NADH-quinone oxidoreductase subunit M